MSDIQFNIPVTVDLVKSDKSDKPERRIRGFASNTNPDRQDETIIQKGLDISNFLNYGWFNFDHDNSHILGYPDKQKTKITPEGLYVEGTLLEGVPIADRMWNVAVALQKSNAPRKLGFSVEGRILERGDNGCIKKAQIYNVAITPNPVNTSATWDAVVKSFSPEYCDNISKATAGLTTNIGDANDGSCLKTESLASALKTLAVVLKNDEEGIEARKRLKSQFMKKSFSEREGILYLQIVKSLSRENAEMIMKKIEL